MTLLRGQCFCGEVRFEMEHLPRTTTHCHCSMCRKIHGAPFVTWVGGKTGTLKITLGESTLKVFQSSKEAKRGFCGQCGSVLFFESVRWPGETSVAAPHIQGALPEKPRAHIFYSDRAAWVEVNDELPKYGGESGTEPLTPHTPEYQWGE